MRLKKSPQLPGAGRTKAWYHHESDTPASPRVILLHIFLLGCVLIYERHCTFHSNQFLSHSVD